MAGQASLTPPATADQGGLKYVFPATFSQQRLWFLDQLNPGDVRYLIPWSIRLTGVLDASALEQALNEIVARHEVLRTTFAADGEDVTQVISDSLQIPLPLIDLTEHSDAEAEVHRLQSAETLNPVDLERGPLVRAQLLRLAPTIHVLLLTLHHIIFDRWSRGIFTRELAALYEAFRDGKPSPLAPVELQYADFAVWQRNHLQGKILADQLDYWKKQLAGAPAELALPLDRPRPAELSSRGAQKLFELPHQLSARLEEFSRHHEVTSFMTLLAAFQALLSRYSGQDDVVVGTPIANRNRRELEGLMGFFANTLALRTDLSGNPSFRDLLSRVKAVTLDAYRHQDLPFERLVQELNPERRLSHNPVFQVLFSLGNLPGQPLELKELELRWGGLPGTTAKFDLSLMMRPQGHGLSGALQYNTDLFDETTIDRLVGHFIALLEGVLDQPAAPVASISLLSPAERHQVLVGWNATERSYPPHCLHELFEEQVQRTPAAIAVIAGEQRLTYAGLNARANQIANYLTTRGAGPDVLIGIFCERKAELLVGILGILKSGSAYVPLDPNYPKQRIQYILEDAHAPVVLTTQSLVDDLPAFDGQTICLDTRWREIAIESAENPVKTIEPRNLAYVLFTSGSTGRPKGVALEHRSASTFVHWAKETFTAEELAGVLLSTSVCFDLSVYEIFVTLSAGGKVIIAENLLYLPALPARNEVTLINTVPSAMAELVGSGGVPASVRVVNLAGEALPDALVEQTYARTDVEKVFNLYGPTEDTTYSSFTLVRRGEKVTIGRPVANTQAYVLDAHLQPQAIGVPGELYLAGAGLARGYYGRPDLTKERFVPNPFSLDRDSRMYRTGDLAKFLPDGNIQYLGRLDHQVKLRGFRIELDEIEAALNTHTDVLQSLVMVREDVLGDKRLVAYIVRRDGTSSADLRRHLQASLPEYMIPAAIVAVPEFPRTPNGKIDRTALAPPETGNYPTRGYEAPKTTTEKEVARIWTEVLKLERVGRRDTFFELGGHSLLAVSVIERMRGIGLQVDVRTLFANPTVAELSGSVSPLEKVVEIPPNGIPDRCQSITPEMLPLVRLSLEDIALITDNVLDGASNVQDIYPLAPLQEGILFHHLMEQVGDPYLLAFQYSFDSRTRLDGFIDAMQATIARHDILRTAVQWEGLPEPVQVVWRQTELPVVEVDLDPGDGDIAKQLWDRFNPRHYRIDIRQAPLLRVCIARDEDSGRWLMMLLLHHLVGDHSMLDLMWEEVRAEMLGTASTLPLPQQFRNLVWQARQGASRADHETFFRKLLGDIDAPTAPFGLLNVRGGGGKINEARQPVDAQLGRRLREQAHRLGVSAASIYHLAWGQVLARLTGREDVVFGTVLFGRAQSGAGSDRAMGLFINTLPVRVGVGLEGAEDALRRTHGRLAELLGHEHASLALAQPCSGITDSVPLFTSLLNYRHSANSAGTDSRTLEGVRPIYSEERTNYPLMLSVDDWGDRFGLKIQVDATIQADRICAYMHTALESLVDALQSEPRKAMRTLEVLGQQEKQKVLFDWNRTVAQCPDYGGVHKWFEQQVRSTPEATALIAGESKLSYAELNARANCVAHRLRKLGVGPETLIGISTDRSFDMVIGVLGVLKAGCAYLPLDPDYPADRLDFILKDASVGFLLTQRPLLASLPPFSGQTICLDTDRDEISRESPENPDGVEDSERLAYVLYTSGSTGKPKGVQITHRNVVNFLASMQEKPGIGKGDSLLAVTTLSFDIAGLELFLPLVSGATVILASREQGRDGRQLIGLMDRWNPTVLQATPATWWILLESGWKGSPSLKALCGGEALPGQLAGQLIPRCHELWNLYGPTETTIWSTIHQVSEAPTGVAAIGRPIANTQAYVLDSTFQPVPVGVIGELYVGGDGVGRGYLNRPDMTSQKFLPDPFVESGRMYRTGDLARFLSDGILEYFGRADDQVKIRGFRIELGEIESTLDHHPAVKQSVIVLREDAPGRKQIVAYVLPRPDTLVTAADLAQHLREALPAYMVPTAFVMLETIPLTANGKVDRKALPPPGKHQETSGYVPPRTPVEEKMAAIWCSVLKLEQVGIRDDFFQAGGHSLLAVELFSRIERVFAIKLPLNLLFTSRTIEDLVAQIKVNDRTQVETSIKPCRTEGSKVPIYAAHGIGGTVLTFRTLVKYLAPDQPVYCLEALGFDRRWKTLEDLATIYIEDLRAFQPEGPYHLIGTSFGGMVVFEMARQLTAQGQQVGLVGLLDSYNMGDPNRRLRRERFAKNVDFVSQRGKVHLKRLLTRSLSQWPRYTVGRLVAVWRRVYGSLWRTAYRTYKTAPANKPSPLRNYKRVYELAGMDYVPKVYSGKIVIFRANGEVRESRGEAHLGWTGLAGGGIEVIDVPGDHNSMIGEPHVQVLAAELTSYLARCIGDENRSEKAMPEVVIPSS